MANNHTFSAPVELHEDDQFRRARLFGIDRKDNALTINPHANNYVRTVTNDVQWDEAIQGAAVSVLSQIPGAALPVRAAYIRSALRPASQAAGRGRFR
jgi:hypothetical protein